MKLVWQRELLPFFVSKCTTSAPSEKMTATTPAVTASSLESPDVRFELTTNGLTARLPCISQHKVEYIATTPSMLYETIDCAASCYFMPVFSSLVRNICVNPS